MGPRGDITANAGSVTHLTKPVEIDEDGGIFYITAVSAGVQFVMSLTPHNLLVGIERSTRAYNEWAVSHREVLAIKTPPVTVELKKKG